MLEDGTPVKHIYKGKAYRTKVENSWYDGKVWRYYVYHSGFLWSVTEDEIKKINKHKKKRKK